MTRTANTPITTEIVEAAHELNNDPYRGRYTLAELAR